MHCRSRRLTSKAETRAPAHSRAGVFACTSNFAAAGRTRGSEAGFPALMTISLAEGNEHATTDQPTNPWTCFGFKIACLIRKPTIPGRRRFHSAGDRYSRRAWGQRPGAASLLCRFSLVPRQNKGHGPSGISGCAGCRSVWICVPRPLLGRLVSDLAKGQTGQARLR